MPPELRRFPWPKWPFYLADVLVVVGAARMFLQVTGHIDLLAVIFLMVTLSAGALLAVLPHLYEARQSAHDSSLPFSSEETPPPGAAPDQGDVLAEIATLAWRIRNRAEKDPEANRVILRNAGKIIDSLGRCGVEIVSYHGRRIYVGSNVEILDAVAGEYNRVLEESTPQVQQNGRLLRRAIVTIGNGVSTPAVPSEAAST